MTKEIEIPLVKATNENLKGYGYLIDSFEIVILKLLLGQNKDGAT